jgi:hypothetical protein
VVELRVERDVGGIASDEPRSDSGESDAGERLTAPPAGVSLTVQNSLPGALTSEGMIMKHSDGASLGTAGLSRRRFCATAVRAALVLPVSLVAACRGATLAVAPAIQEIVAGRRPMSDYDGLVKDWRAGGGDQMRAEYEQAYAAAR